MKMTYEETLAYIHRISWTGSRPGLERITELLNKMGNPQKGLRFIHVAGTNGKGSVCKMTDTILRKAGYHTGLYVSPYIRFFNERMQADGKMISDDDLAELTGYVRSFADTMTDPPTEFELITAIAMEFFKRKKCDPVVLEVGMGGRLDATNLIEDPILSIITGIALDHTAILGDTIPKIAAEKAGIIKKGCPVLFGGHDDDAWGVIEKRAEEVGSKAFRTAFDKQTQMECRLGGASFKFGRFRYEISLSGLYQPMNAACVLTAIPLLRKRGLRIPPKAVKEGLRETVWEGRFETLCRDPLVIFDGSHNPEGIASASESIRTYFPDRKVFLLSGVMKDKDYQGIADMLSPFAEKVFTLRPDNPRALDSESYAGVYRSRGIPAEPSGSIPEAVGKAFAAAKEKKLPLIILGSLYMYGDVRREIEILAGN